MKKRKVVENMNKHFFPMRKRSRRKMKNKNLIFLLHFIFQSQNKMIKFNVIRDKDF